MFHAGGHIGWGADLPDTVFKEDHPTTIVTKFGYNWPSGFRGEDLWMKSLRRTTGAKWWQKLTLAIVRWAKNYIVIYKTTQKTKALTVWTPKV